MKIPVWGLQVYNDNHMCKTKKWPKYFSGVFGLRSPVTFR